MNGSLLLCGIGIHFTPDILKSAQDMKRLPFKGTFKDGMLNKMSHPLFLRCFIA